MQDSSDDALHQILGCFVKVGLGFGDVGHCRAPKIGGVASGCESALPLRHLKDQLLFRGVRLTILASFRAGQIGQTRSLCSYVKLNLSLEFPSGYFSKGIENAES